MSGCGHKREDHEFPRGPRKPHPHYKTKQGTTSPTMLPTPNQGAWCNCICSCLDFVGDGEICGVASRDFYEVHIKSEVKLGES